MLVDREVIYLNKSNIDNLSSDKDYIINPELFSSDNKLLIDIPDNYNVRFFLKVKSNVIIDNYDISFIQHNNSNVEFYFSIRTSSDLNVRVYNIVSGSNNKTLVKGRVFNDLENTNTKVLVSGDINKNTHDNVYTEDIRGIKLKNNNLEIDPDLLVSTSQVEANHMVSIGSFDDDVIEYLKEKGIKYGLIKTMLTDSFLNSIFESGINEVLDNYL